jgi:RNA polymerase sigma-70 factor (ECF subfamily)
MTGSSTSTLELAPVVSRDRIAPDTSGIQAEVLSLFDEFRDPLLRYVCAFGIRICDGEDLIQDVFLALFRHLCRDGSRENLQGWLFRVAHNLALKQIARQRRQSARSAAVQAAFSTPDPGLGLEQDLVRHEQQLRLLAVFEALPERDRHCVRLRAEGLRYRDIARVLGISLGAVSKSLTRAIGRLGRAVGR